MGDDIQIPKGPFGQLQDDCLALLKADAYFADVVVLTENMKEITYEIERVLGTLTDAGGTLGICVIILTPKLKVTRPNLPVPVFDDVGIVVRVIEDPLINQGDGGSKKRAADVAYNVARVLHHKAKDTLYNPILTLDCGPTVDNDLPAAVIYDVRFQTSLKQ